MKKKNNKSRLSEFIRYTRGEMTRREENAFQRELQKDPFAEDAAEGLSQISAEEALSDLHILEKRLKTRISGRQRIIYYRIAASIAVLMIISSVFIIINKNKPSARELAENGVQIPLEIPESKVIEEPEKEALPVLMSEAEKREDVAPAAKEPELFVAEDRAAAAAPATSFMKTALTEVRGTIISSEDNLPIPGAFISLKGTNTSVITDTEGRFSISLSDTTRPILVANFIGMESREFRAKEDTDMKISLTPTATALSEIVVLAYGGAKASKGISGEEAEKSEYDNSGYTSARPATGKENFDKYIEDNIQNPASLPSGQRAVVVLSFLVRSTGTIDSIKVMRTPGPGFSEEAIRLIKAGPQWKPAEENGRTIDDEVKIRIVFYKNNDNQQLPN